MAERMPSARVVVLNRCGHWTPIERPDECRRELRDFLSSQREPVRSPAAGRLSPGLRT
jgi:hypothetical protein